MPAEVPKPKGELFRIISVTPMMDIDELGRFFKIYRVRFKVKEVVEDFIDIPAPEFTAEEAEKRVKEKADIIVKLMKLE